MSFGFGFSRKYVVKTIFFLHIKTHAVLFFFFPILVSLCEQQPAIKILADKYITGLCIL